MSELLYINILEGQENCKIFIENRISEFENIKDKIIRIDFNNIDDKNEYIKKINSYFDYFIVLSDKQLFYVMENAESNKQYYLRNTNNVLDINFN